MKEGDETAEQAEPVLSEPSRELAERVTRKVSWKNRIEGYTYIRGPGEMWEHFCRLEELYNMLSALPHFKVSFGTLKRWVGETLGDEELAEKIEGAMGEDPAKTRSKIVNLLGLRLEQCAAVLGTGEEE